MTEYEMVGWHRLVNRHEFGQTPGKPGVLQSMGLKRVGHDLETEQVYYQCSNQINLSKQKVSKICSGKLFQRR